MSFQDATGLREKMALRSHVLRPAIAGLIVDQMVDYKEVFATFVQLVVEGYVAVVPSRKVIRTDKKGGLYGFESFLLDSVFRDGNELDEKAAISRLKELDLTEFALIIMDELVEQGLADRSSTLVTESPAGRTEASTEIDVSGGENDSTIVRKKEMRSEYSTEPEKKKGLLGSIANLFSLGGSKVVSQSTTVTSRRRITRSSGEMPPGSGPLFKGKPTKLVVNGREITDPAEIDRFMKDFGTGNMDGLRPFLDDSASVADAKRRMVVNGREITDPEEIDRFMKKFKAGGWDRVKSDLDGSAPISAGKTRVVMNGKEITDPAEVERTMRRMEGFKAGMTPAEHAKTPAKGAVGGFSFKHTPKADVLVAEYRELEAFLRRFPVSEDRFSNEFVAFNIAFNLRDCTRLPR